MNIYYYSIINFNLPKQVLKLTWLCETYFSFIHSKQMMHSHPKADNIVSYVTFRFSIFFYQIHHIWYVSFGIYYIHSWNTYLKKYDKRNNFCNQQNVHHNIIKITRILVVWKL